MSIGDVLNGETLDILFREARTLKKWHDRDVSEVTIHALYDLLKFGPTSANCCPARFVFIKSPEAKARLKPHLDADNVGKTMSAPVNVIVAYDLEFYEKLGALFPHEPTARSWFAGQPNKIKEAAFRNGSLQGAYLILAARALGLDCGPMSGFDAAGVKAEFFKDSAFEPNFLCNLGYGDRSSLHPRSPRLGFDEACKIL
jgi:3-hydroxypropanoate dehydrogenase